ncbi:hypothetical protein Pfo_029195 [Paulownia fortunei]|nr:hypothetical protein Pfo_029195 [Paulownia fortunei]
MVLWEITLGTAYFLGLKRTYKLALKIQRKLISPKHPKIRQFVQRCVHTPTMVHCQYFVVQIGPSQVDTFLHYIQSGLMKMFETQE